MSLEAITLVRTLPRSGIRLRPRNRFVLYALADYADDNLEAWPSFRSLAEWTGYTRTTIIDALSSLEEAGLIARQGRRRDDGSMTSNTYRIMLPPQSGTRTGGSNPRTPPSKPRTPRSATRTPPSEDLTPGVREPDGGSTPAGRGVVREPDPMIHQLDPSDDPPQTRPANVGETRSPEPQETHSETPSFDPMLLTGFLAEHIPRHRLDRLGRDWQRRVLQQHTPESIAVLARYAAGVKNPEPDLLEKCLDGRVEPSATLLRAITRDIRTERAHEHPSPA